jgi:outer membrane protein TolC
MPSKRLSYLSHQHHCILWQDLAAPLINRNAIKAEFSSANARQIQAMYNYERVILNAYLEVSNQLSNIDNLEKALI